MDAGLIGRIESGIERSASALFGAAAGFVVYRLLSSSVPRPEIVACAACGAVMADLLCLRILKSVARRSPKLKLSVFDLRDIETFEPEGELLLTDADRVAFADASGLVLTDSDRLHPKLPSAADEPLVLDDILAEIGPDSRVVRLFDRQAMPTPGQLKSRIDSHLVQGSAAPTQGDAAQALSEALEQLRRSLR